MKDLRGKVVVVTGAASGIGRATALAFARERARVHLVDIDAEALGRTLAELEALRLPGATLAMHAVDCRDAAAMEELAAEIFRTEGRVDVLHNNAGVCVGGPVEQIKLEDWRWIVDVNLWGVVHGIRAFLPRMIAKGCGGHVVNTASMAGLVGLPYVVPYCTTKAAVIGLSEALDAELAVHAIRVTAVCPGAVRTSVMRSARLELPGPWHQWISKAFDRYSPSPEQLAKRIVRAVVAERSMLLHAGEMAPLWVLKRLSTPLYQQLARWATVGAVRLGAARAGKAAARPARARG